MLHSLPTSHIIQSQLLVIQQNMLMQQNETDMNMYCIVLIQLNVNYSEIYTQTKKMFVLIR